MVDIMDVYRSFNISPGTAMKNPEMLQFVSGHPKTKICVSIQLKNYLSIKICSWLIQDSTNVWQSYLENGGTLKSIPNFYKNQEICHKAVDKYPHAVEFVPECFVTQKMCDKAVNTYPSTIKFVPNVW